MRLVTWNLDGLDDRRLDERTEAACFALLLRVDPPDVCLFQEVIARSLLAHLRPHFSAAGYVCVPAAPPDREYFVAMMVRRPVKEAWFRPFPGSQMGRGLLGARVDLDGEDLLVCTSHLESLLPSRDERMHQLALVAGLLASHPGPALFAGDTNLRDVEFAAVPEAAQLSDAWEAAGKPKDARWTWYPRSGGRGFRFDRVYTDRRPGWKVQGIRTFGGEELVGVGMAVSDHLGLEVTLERA